jgi:hypothetical protein
MTMKLDPSLAMEAKALVALAFCNGEPAISHISDEEMKRIMKAAVNKVYSLLWQRDNDSEAYIKSLVLGGKYSHNWDDPDQ